MSASDPNAPENEQYPGRNETWIATLTQLREANEYGSVPHSMVATLRAWEAYQVLSLLCNDNAPAVMTAIEQVQVVQQLADR